VPLPSVAAFDLASIEAVFTDLDGTLLRNDGGLSDRTVRALEAAQTAGLHVVVVTGRLPGFVYERFRDLPIAPVAGASNGALLLDPHNGELRERHLFSREQRDDVIARLEAALPGIFTGYQHSDRLYMPRQMLDALTWTGTDVTGPFDDVCFRVYAHHPGYADQRDIHELLQATLPECSVSICAPAGTPTVQWFDVHGDQSDKGTALVSIAAELDVATERCLAIGDEDNDVPMFERAGLAVAMGNAYPRVAARCNAQTESNDEDGVARVIEAVLAAKERTGAAA
jgi:Cof subfamily protein (haloacid dehalogenase superfamily)